MPQRIIKKNSKQDQIYSRIRQIIESARSNIARAVHHEMVQAYWLIGREIVEEEQQGKNRAAYGEALLQSLSEKLTRDFGKGFDDSNLRYIRKFYLSFPIRDALRHELAWSHYRILMRIEKPEARSFYEIECVKNNWSARELERQKGSFLFERLALSKDKKEAVVRYTLPKKNKQIFASKYKLYLPTEKELKTEIKREKLVFESHKRL